MKELNLTELLKGCREKEFYSPIFGTLILKILNKNYIEVETIGTKCTKWFYPDGSYSMNGVCMLYPSKKLYKRYSSNAPKAWSEWKESRQPERWRAKSNGRYFYVSSYLEVEEDFDHGTLVDDSRWDNGNYFSTSSRAGNAAQALRECLMQFNERGE